MLSDIHTRLEAWRKGLPQEMEPREGMLSSVLVMHMFFQLLFIHLFRPFLKYTSTTSPLPPAVSPRKLCTQAAASISKLMRLYKRSFGLRQICNIAAYIAHSACTIHLLNLPDRNAKRDITHGVKHLEEISEGWLCARRSLHMLSLLGRKWKVALPDEAAAVLARAERKLSSSQGDGSSPALPKHPSERMVSPSAVLQPAVQQEGVQIAAQPSRAQSSSPAAAVAQSQAPAATSVPIANYNANQPANDVADLYPQYQLSTSAPVQTNQSQQQAQPVRKGPSPSDMFGGVEQLLRDSQDWVYRDKTQIATGFGNWTSLNMDPSTWANAVVVDESMPNNLPMDGGVPPGMQMPNANAQTGLFGMNGNGSMGGYPVMDWLNSQTLYNNTMAYNEDDWYQ